MYICTATLFSQSTGETSAEDQSTASVEVEVLRDKSELNKNSQSMDYRIYSNKTYASFEWACVKLDPPINSRN